MQHMTAPELAALLSSDTVDPPVLLDVREPWEFQKCKLDQSVLIPMNSVLGQLEEINPDATIVCICHHGARSMRVALFLESSGYSNVINLSGGIHAWAQLVDPAMPTY